MVASGYLRHPGVLLTLHTGPQVICIELVDTASGKPQPTGCGLGFDLPSPKAGEDVAD